MYTKDRGIQYRYQRFHAVDPLFERKCDYILMNTREKFPSPVGDLWVNALMHTFAERTVVADAYEMQYLETFLNTLGQQIKKQWTTECNDSNENNQSASIKETCTCESENCTAWRV